MQQRLNPRIQRASLNKRSVMLSPIIEKFTRKEYHHKGVNSNISWYLLCSSSQIHQRTPIFIGSPDEVEKLQTFLAWSKISLFCFLFSYWICLSISSHLNRENGKNKYITIKYIWSRILFKEFNSSILVCLQRPP